MVAGTYSPKRNMTAFAAVSRCNHRLVWTESSSPKPAALNDICSLPQSAIDNVRGGGSSARTSKNGRGVRIVRDRDQEGGRREGI